MFDTVRNNSKVMMGLLFLLIIPSFVMFGIEGYSRFSDQAATVARVDGQKITQLEWDEAHKREVDRIRAQSPTLDTKLFDTPQAREATLERLVNDRVLAVAAQKQLLNASDLRLARELQSNPVIAGLRGPDGKLDMERYRQLVAAQGMTPDMFENRVRQDLSLRQVLEPVQASALPLTKPTESAVQAFLQRREVQVRKFAASDHVAQARPSEADLEAFYKQHAERFRSVETADVEYLVLDANSLMAGVTVPEQDLKSYYEQNLQTLVQQEQRRASHILIGAPSQAPAAEREKAKAEALALLAQVRKSPKSFAAVAREKSQDPGSAAKGGDLDLFARRAMGKPFGDAVFGLKEGQISDLVETDYGYHIIQLTGIQSAKTPSYEAMRPKLEADLRKQQAQRKFAELAEAFSNSVYEQSEALKPVADKFKLSLQQASGVSREPGKSLPAALQHPKVLQALFAPEALRKQRNTEAIEIAPSTLVSARVLKHHPSVLRPLAEVRDELRTQWVRQRAAELARAEGQAQLQAWQAKPEGAALGAAVVVSRDQPQAQPRALVDAALRADPAKLPALVGVDLGNEGYAVLRVNKIVPREAQSEAQAAATRQQFAQLWAQAEVQAYLEALKKQFKVELLAVRAKSAGGAEKP